MRGPGVVPGRVLSGGDPGDVMPTMAWLLGLPLSDELMGEPLADAFEDAFVAARPIERVESYGPRVSTPIERSPEDAIMLESLRALGYIE